MREIHRAGCRGRGASRQDGVAMKSVDAVPRRCYETQSHQECGHVWTMLVGGLPSLRQRALTYNHPSQWHLTRSWSCRQTSSDKDDIDQGVGGGKSEPSRVQKYGAQRRRSPCVV